MGKQHRRPSASPARHERRFLEKHERINRQKGISVKISMKTASASLQALGYLCTSIAFDEGAGVPLGIALKHCREANEIFDLERKKLAKKYGKKDAEGNPIVDKQGNVDQAVMDFASREQFDDAIEKLRAREIDIPVDTVKRSQITGDKVLPFIFADLDWLIVADAAPAESPKKK
jgi:hypothetical protein